VKYRAGVEKDPVEHRIFTREKGMRKYLDSSLEPGKELHICVVPLKN